MRDITKDDFVILKKDFDLFTSNIEQYQFIEALYCDRLLDMALRLKDDNYNLAQNELLYIFRRVCTFINVDINVYLGGSNE